MNNIKSIFNKLERFDSVLKLFFDPIDLKTIDNAEERIGKRLPIEYINFLRFSNGAYILNELIYGLDTKDKALDGLIHYNFERNEAENPIYDYLFPISPDGRGNHYCLDLKSITKDIKTCNVVFWQHDYLYTTEETPDIDTNSFLDFLIKLIDDYSENYDYDGSEK
jgi:cell wall assembly regulator SMI1